MMAGKREPGGVEVVAATQHRGGRGQGLCDRAISSCLLGPRAVFFFAPLRSYRLAPHCGSAFALVPSARKRESQALSTSAGRVGL